MKIVDLTGKKFNRLTVVKLAGGSRGGSKVWECLCDCGNTALATTRHLNRKNCVVGSCGCLTKDRVGEKHSDWTGVGEISGTFWVSHVVRSAKGNPNKGRGEIELSVTKQDVWDLYQKQQGKCALSGLPIQFPTKWNDGTYTASLDRIDSSKGYIKGNIQWVHKHINIMKNIYGQEHFIELCTAIAENNKK